jgi:hypothetical protein
MFNARQKQEIARKVQEALRATGNAELPKGEIRFNLYVDGEQAWSWSNIVDNGRLEY